MLINKPIFGGMSDTVLLLKGARNAFNATPAAYGLLDHRAESGK